MATASSSSSFFGIGEDDQSQIKQQQSSTPTSSAAPSTAPQKKRRNLPGTPNPDAEVIALSPKTLMATNRFICEVCNKGFQREQNLQLHRRGHNLPWKLKQKTTKEVRRKVYLCPEPTCVHHEPSRALGDLTGIKKHFCRKHGEKKWKCDKCSKRYAVQSDLKAHSKTCGTREYRCDCGTLFSRRDSFITHRAFCDALAQESARLPTGLNTMGSHLYGSSNMGLGLSQMGSQIPTLQDHNHPSGDLLRLGGATGSQFDHLINAPSNTSSFRPASSASNQSSAFFLPSTNHNYIEEPQPNHGIMQNKPFHGLTQLPDLHNNTNASPAQPPNLFNLSFFSGSSTSSSINNNNNNNNNNNATNNNYSSGLFIPDQLSSANGGGEPTTLFSGNMMGDHMSSGVSSLYTNSVQNDSLLPQMSATALLQKAAQMGSTTSGNGSSLLRGFGCPSSSGSGKPDRPHLSANFGGSFGDGGGDSMSSQIENESHIQDLMNSLANGGPSMFGGAGTRGSVSPFGGHEQESEFVGFNAPRRSLEQQRHQGLCNMDEPKMRHNLAISMGGSDRLTRDFLGVGGMVRSMGGGGISQREQHHGIDMSSLDSEMKSTPSGSRSFGGGNLQ